MPTRHACTHQLTPLHVTCTRASKVCTACTWQPTPTACNPSALCVSQHPPTPHQAICVSHARSCTAHRLSCLPVIHVMVYLSLAATLPAALSTCADPPLFPAALISWCRGRALNHKHSPMFWAHALEFAVEYVPPYVCCMCAPTLRVGGQHATSSSVGILWSPQPSAVCLQQDFPQPSAHVLTHLYSMLP